jgi:hypothetical protein
MEPMPAEVGSNKLPSISFLPFVCVSLSLSLVFLVVKTRVYKGVSPVVSVCRFPSATIMTAASALRKDGP